MTGDDIELVTHEPIRVVHVESAASPHSWWPVWMIGATAGLVTAIALTFTLVTSVQRADRSDDRANENAELDQCRALFAAEITEAQQTSNHALNELVVLISRQLLATSPPSQERFTTAIDHLETTNAAADTAVDQREEWFAGGSPLPCPLQAGGDG